jgi:hypothetical protein
MLHQTTYLMHTSKKVPYVNGPWWDWNQLLLNQKSQLHQEIIWFLLSQMYKSLPWSPRSLLLPFEKLGMM